MTDTQSNEDIRRELIALKSADDDWVLNALGVNDPYALTALVKFIHQKQMKEVQRFAGLYGIGGDGNDHVATYRKVYSNRMNQLEDAIGELGVKDD